MYKDVARPDEFTLDKVKKSDATWQNYSEGKSLIEKSCATRKESQDILH